ncbi:MAG: T9SS type A sorting domain-containing protein [Flavipsychrobacter sp.]
MKRIIIAIGVLLFGLTANAQMTLEKDYLNVNSDVLNDADVSMEIVNLSKSGRKYLVRDMKAGQLRIYDLNHSLWKTINLPNINNYEPTYAAYTSEELFNLDAQVEVAVYYSNTLPSVYVKKLVIVNEAGNILNNIDSAGVLKIYSTGTNSYNAILQTGKEKYTIYKLPGTIPCDKCGNGLGLAKIGRNNPIGNISNPIPNPSNTQTTVDYTLPIGATSGILDIYNMNGQKVKSYNVDNTFNSLLIDNTELSSGTYYYHLTANGESSETKKMVVIK